jgi:hypothetical protein
MDTFLLILKSLFMTIGLILAIVYILSNFWQKVPQVKFKLKVYDWILYILTALIFGVGFNEYWFLLAFAPLLAWKIFAHFTFQKNKVRGKGRWAEINWLRITPRGYDIPKQMANELGKLPGNTHILIPRFALMFLLGQGMKILKKNASQATSKLPANMKGKEHEAFDLLNKTENNIRRLEIGKTEALNLPFGVLKVTRL